MPSEERTNTPIGIFMAIAFSALQYENRVPTFDLYNGIQKRSQLGVCYLPVDRAEGSQISLCMER